MVKAITPRDGASGKTAKVIEDELEAARQRSDALGKALDAAKHNYPVKPEPTSDDSEA